jgi:hypothetical protein
MSTQKNKTNQPSSENHEGMIFTKQNYVLTAAAVLVIVIGFFMMAGKDGNIYDFRRTTLAPIVVIAGFILGIFAIFYKKK